MADDLRERLLASYADLGEAMVIQNVLEASGVPCRVADLGHIPAHMFGIAGALGRSVGIWVLEADVERAASLLATMGASESGVDEEALAAEAMAAPAPSSDEPAAEQVIAPARARPPLAREAHPRRSAAIFVLLSVVAALLASRACS